MDPDHLRPVIRESLEFLRRHRLEPSDLAASRGFHHFSGYGLWCRNRFLHLPGSELHVHFGACPDTVSTWLTDLIVQHGEADEATWRTILADDPGPLPLFPDSFTKTGLAECSDEEL